MFLVSKIKFCTVIGFLSPPPIHSTRHLYPAQSFDLVTFILPIPSSDCNKFLTDLSVACDDIPEFYKLFSNDMKLKIIKYIRNLLKCANSILIQNHHQLIQSL